MDKTFVCEVSEEEKKECMDIFEMKGALENLVLIIARNNEILKEDSSLYERIKNDYLEITRREQQFWGKYLEKYQDVLDEHTQLSLDFHTNKMYRIPVKLCASKNSGTDGWEERYGRGHF